jgi:aerobic-type carbon monoxide dehydrogenase small subunit (CoxS/CutS family)
LIIPHALHIHEAHAAEIRIRQIFSGTLGRCTDYIPIVAAEIVA